MPLLPSNTLHTTITFLEMKSPQKLKISRPSNIQAALLRTDNIPLHFYRYLQHRVGGPYHWVYRLRMSDERLEEIIYKETTKIDVLYVDGIPSGFYELDCSDPSRTDISYFGLMPHMIGKHMGKWLLSQAIHAAWDNEPERVTVNTCTLDHPNALGLYQKLGFNPIRQSQNTVIPLSDEEILTLAKSE